jgi:STE24 endopeptidase
VIEPLFNRFERLPDGRLRSQVLDLAKRSDVDVGEVYRVDASRRTTGVNAYVNGIGHTKRVVLYDNLIDKFARDQVDSVVAHELAHVRHRDVPRGLLWLAIVAPAAVLLVQRLTERIAGPDAGLGARRGPANALALPAVALSVGIAQFGLGIASNALSRPVERSADAYALNLTSDPAAFIAVERRLAVDNVAEPDPPKLLSILFGTHPTTIDRIGAALTWSAQQR